MSYEGYEVHYCENGHKLGEWDALDPYLMDYWSEEEPSQGHPVHKCEVCGSEEVFIDHVDQTNPCYGSEDTEDGSSPEDCDCPCHEKVKKAIGFTLVKCDRCDGTGESQEIVLYAKVGCECSGEDFTCEKCFGTGIKFEATEKKRIVCSQCLSRGKIAIPVWDIEILKNRKKL